MNREQYTPPQRQFIHPMSTFYGNMPVSTPEAPELLSSSQMLSEEQVGLAQPDMFTLPTSSSWPIAQVEPKPDAWQDWPYTWRDWPSGMSAQTEQASGQSQVISSQTTRIH